MGGRSRPGCPPWRYSICCITCVLAAPALQVARSAGWPWRHAPFTERTHARQTPAPALQVVPPAFHDAFIHGRAQACLHWACRLHAGSAQPSVQWVWLGPNPREKFVREPHRESCCWLQDSDCEMDSDYEGSGISDFQEDEMTPMVSVAVCMPGGAVATVLFACAASV